MDALSGSLREWYYIDSNGGAQKGPVPAIVLSKLLEKGIGVTAQTLVWKNSMTEWLPMANVEPFKSIVDFQTKQWYYIDSEKAQQGPVISRLLVHKLKQKDIDGTTLVFGGGLSEWKHLSEIPELNMEMMKIAADEEAMLLAAAAVTDDEVQQKKVFLNNEMFVTDKDSLIPPEQSHHAERESAKHNVASAVEGKKSFVGDDGIRYGWDEATQDWVEVNDEDDVADMVFSDEEEEDEEVEIQDTKKRKADDASTEDTDAATASAISTAQQPKKKRSKKKRTRKLPNTWVYITGLPSDVTAEEVNAHFSKVGLIALSPYDQQPYIKLYRDEETGECKGDCSLCYNAEESAVTAVEFLDGGYIRPSHKVAVKRADFTSSGESNSVSHAGTSSSNHHKKASLSHAQIKVARSAIQQALTWNEDDDIGVSRAAALRIIVLEGMFSLSEFTGAGGDTFAEELEGDIAGECEKCGEIEKITVFSKNPRGVVVVKFGTSYGAQECVKLMHNRYFGGRRIKCIFWDGVTNYSVVGNADKAEELEAKQEQERLGEFGDWLDKEQEDLPDEFKLRTE